MIFVKIIISEYYLRSSLSNVLFITCILPFCFNRTLSDKILRHVFLQSLGRRLHRDEEDGVVEIGIYRNTLFITLLAQARLTSKCRAASALLAQTPL